MALDRVAAFCIAGWSMAIVVTYYGLYMNAFTSPLPSTYRGCSCTDRRKVDVGRNISAATQVTSHEASQEPLVNDRECVFPKKDDDSLARQLYKQVRVLCWVMTSEDNLWKKARHVQATWARHCNVALFVSDSRNDTFPTIDVTAPKGRWHLTMKTMKAFDYIYKHHMDDADWFLKADDDTYVIVENLRYFLSSQNSSEPGYFGKQFNWIVKQGYHSGGAGYVLSQEALRRFGNRKEKQCADDYWAEDVQIGRCLQALGVRAGDSRDAKQRNRFQHQAPSTYMGVSQKFLERHKHDKYPPKEGMDGLSDYAISFHKIPPDDMYTLEYFFYHLKVYGIIHAPQDLNYHASSATSRNKTAVAKTTNTTETRKNLVAPMPKKL